MRHIVYLLLVANLVYLGWNLFPGNSLGDSFSALPPIPEGAKPLVTLKEMQQQAGSPEAGAIEALTATEPPGAGMQACQTLGPFENPEQATAVTAQLDKLGLQSRQRIAQVRKENGYWVYLPSMERAAALEITHKLDENGDSDYYLGRDNFIALGTFNDIARAEVRLKQVHKLGLDAILEARFTEHDTYWLEFHKLPSAGGELSAILGKDPQLQLHELECL
jgi:hypothetical protein